MILSTNTLVMIILRVLKSSNLNLKHNGLKFNILLFEISEFNLLLLKL